MNLAQLRSIPPYLLATLLPRQVIDAFHVMWYRADDTHRANTFLGYKVDQQPMDLWLYQELIFRERPAFVVQTGVFQGGSMLYFARLLDLMEAPPSAVVIGVDIELSVSAKTLSHPRIHLIEGSSTSAETLAKIDALKPAEFGFVSLDSDHSRDHVLAELRAYQRLVPPGGHLVVEDTNVYGHPVFPSHGPGPMEAVDLFLNENDAFIRDDALWQRMLYSHHQKGWLQRRH